MQMAQLGYYVALIFKFLVLVMAKCTQVNRPLPPICVFTCALETFRPFTPCSRCNGTWGPTRLNYRVQRCPLSVIRYPVCRNANMSPARISNIYIWWCGVKIFLCNSFQGNWFPAVTPCDWNLYNDIFVCGQNFFFKTGFH